jgi:tetratricopeptide (TPR) repeat protein
VALNTLGFLLLAETQASRRDRALDAFRENVRRFPRSANVYDSMGDGFRALGQREAAIVCYAASVRTGRAFPDEGEVFTGSTIAPQSLGKMGVVARELDRPAWTPETIPERVTADCLAGRAR